MHFFTIGLTSSFSNPNLSQPWRTQRIVLVADIDSVFPPNNLWCLHYYTSINSHSRNSRNSNRWISFEPLHCGLYHTVYETPIAWSMLSALVRSFHEPSYWLDSLFGLLWPSTSYFQHIYPTLHNFPAINRLTKYWLNTFSFYPLFSLWMGSRHWADGFCHYQSNWQSSPGSSPSGSGVERYGRGEKNICPAFGRSGECHGPAFIKYSSRFCAIRRVVNDSYPFIWFSSIVFIPFVYWVSIIETGTLVSSDDVRT